MNPRTMNILQAMQRLDSRELAEVHSISANLVDLWTRIKANATWYLVFFLLSAGTGALLDKAL